MKKLKSCNNELEDQLAEERQRSNQLEFRLDEVMQVAKEDALVHQMMLRDNEDTLRQVNLNHMAESE